MGDMLFVEKLAWFKQNEKPEVVLIVAENPDLIKIVIAWTSLDVRCTDSFSNYSGTHETEAWEWLWANTVYDVKKLKEIIGISLGNMVLENKLKRLINNRIIYPDGTVNSYVERYLREKVIHLFVTRLK